MFMHKAEYNSRYRLSAVAADAVGPSQLQPGSAIRSAVVHVDVHQMIDPAAIEGVHIDLEGLRPALQTERIWHVALLTHIYPRVC